MVANIPLIIFVSNLFIMSCSLLVFSIVLFRQFIRKRTIGTILLTISYLLLAIGESSQAFSYIVYFFFDQRIVVAQLQIGYVLFASLGYIFLYLFANR